MLKRVLIVVLVLFSLFLILPYFSWESEEVPIPEMSKTPIEEIRTKETVSDTSSQNTEKSLTDIEKLLED